MKVVQSLTFLLPLATTVTAHGYIKAITIDGIEYPGYSPMVDPSYPGVKRIVYGFPTQNTRGVGPVLDPTTPDIACRKGATTPALVAPARAGSNITFQWTNYFTSHKGPVLTYMARMDSPTQSVNELKFFKIDEGTYDPKTGTWGSDVVIKQNNTWTSRIPSDLKPGDYVVRHELIALHFGLWGNAQGHGSSASGAQFIPECMRIKLSGTGTATPPGQPFPGQYHGNDPGIKINIYFGPNAYKSPGGPVYRGKIAAPVGPAPKAGETGYFTGSQRQSYDGYVNQADAMFHSIVKGVNSVLPGGGGNKYNAGQGALNTPVNGGQSLMPIASLLAGGLLPLGVVPGVGAVGGSGSGGDAKSAGGKAGAPKTGAPKTAKGSSPKMMMRVVKRSGTKWYA